MQRLDDIIARCLRNFHGKHLSKHLERAEKTVRIIDVKYGAVNALADGTPAAYLQLIALLKSCSAFEAFRKMQASQLQAWRVTEYLLLGADFPRAVRFCLRSSMDSLDALSGEGARRS